MMTCMWYGCITCIPTGSNALEILHILEDGSLETNESAEKRLMKLLKIPETDLFAGPEDLIAQAYDVQGEKITYHPADATGSE